MCKIGDIIVIKSFKNEIGETIHRHSFVVISDESNVIKGMNYDIVSNMICSFHNKEHRRHKLSFIQNIEVKEKSIYGKFLNRRKGFIKADQLYYFNKLSIDYFVIGRVSDELLNELINVILSLTEKGMLKRITTNLNE